MATLKMFQAGVCRATTRAGPGRVRFQSQVIPPARDQPEFLDDHQMCGGRPAVRRCQRRYLPTPRSGSRAGTGASVAGYIRAIHDLDWSKSRYPTLTAKSPHQRYGFGADDEYAQIERRQVPAMITGKPIGLGGQGTRFAATGRGAFAGGAAAMGQTKISRLDQPLPCRVSATRVTTSRDWPIEAGYRIVAISDLGGAGRR
jgi:hypothetical protein